MCSHCYRVSQEQTRFWRSLETRPGCRIACTEMTKTKKIEILQAVHVVELSWASIVIIFSFKSLHLGFRALP